MAEKDPLSAISSVNKGLGETETRLTRLKNSLRQFPGLLGQVGQGFTSAFSFSGAQGSAMGLGTSGASFGAGGAGNAGMMMPWLYTKSGFAAYAGAQATLGVGAAAYSMMPDLQTALATRSGYYTQALLGRGGMTAANMAQRNLTALAGGVTSPTDAMAAGSMLSFGYNYNPGGASYLRAMQEVGGAARMMNIANPQAAQAIGGLHTGTMSSRLYQVGISTLDPKTGTTRSTEDIFRQLYNRLFQGRQVSAQDIEIALREGFAGAELRNVFGFNETQMQMFQQAATNFSQGKRFNLPDATGKGNPALDIYRQQSSLAVTTETKADELLAGLTSATDAYVKLNQQLQGDNGVVNGFAKLKGFLQGLFGTNAGGAVSSIVSTAGAIGLNLLAFRGLKAAGLVGSRAAATAAGTAATTAGATGFMGAGRAAMAGATATAGASAAGTAAANSAARAGAGVAARVGGVALGRAVPVIGGVIGAETGQGFLSTVAIGAIGGGIAGAVTTGGAAAIPGALIGGTLAGVGWLASKAFHSMFATSNTQQASSSGSTGDMNQEQFASSVLQRIGAPVTSQNLSAMLTWMKAEGGHWGNTAKYNPLNTTLTTGTSVNYNTGKKGRGVQAFASWEEGVQATADTIQGSNFTGIYSALLQGNSATAVLQQAQNSKWAVGNYGYKLASSPLVTPSGSASTTVSSGGQTVNINLTIDKASDAEAIRLAKKVKEILLNDKTLLAMGGK